MVVSIPHGEIHSPAKFCELTGVHWAPRHDPNDTLVSVLEYARHKTGSDCHVLWGTTARMYLMALLV